MFPVVHNTTVDVSWNCNEEGLSKEERKELVYCVEVKKTTGGERGWKEVYRGEDKKCSVSGLEKGTEYYVRVRCVIGEEKGMWSDVAAFRTKIAQIN